MQKQVRTNTKDTTLVQLGQRIKDLRLSKGLTQAELAKKSNIAANYIAMLERGERNATYLTLLKLAEGLEVKVGELF